MVERHVDHDNGWEAWRTLMKCSHIHLEFQAYTHNSWTPWGNPDNITFHVRGHCLTCNTKMRCFRRDGRPEKTTQHVALEENCKKTSPTTIIWLMQLIDMDRAYSSEVARYAYVDKWTYASCARADSTPEHYGSAICDSCGLKVGLATSHFSHALLKTIGWTAGAMALGAMIGTGVGALAVASGATVAGVGGTAAIGAGAITGSASSGVVTFLNNAKHNGNAGLFLQTPDYSKGGGWEQFPERTSKDTELPVKSVSVETNKLQKSLIYLETINSAEWAKLSESLIISAINYNKRFAHLQIPETKTVSRRAGKEMARRAYAAWHNSSSRLKFHWTVEESTEFFNGCTKRLNALTVTFGDVSAKDLLIDVVMDQLRELNKSERTRGVKEESVRTVLEFGAALGGAIGVVALAPEAAVAGAIVGGIIATSEAVEANYHSQIAINKQISKTCGSAAADIVFERSVGLNN